MRNNILNDLQLREVFHLEFLSRLARKLKPDRFCLKGGCNLRFFYGSVRYSEDMDLDARGIATGKLRDITLKILDDKSLLSSLSLFGISGVRSPDMTKAKQTETTQRFKIHLLTRSGADLFTKVEYSRRGFNGDPVIEAPSGKILRMYKMAPILVPHYDLRSQITQKVECLASPSRAAAQARDIFDLYLLSAQYAPETTPAIRVTRACVAQASKNVAATSFRMFRDTVLEYLAPEDRASHDSAGAWEEITFKTAAFLKQIG